MGLSAHAELGRVCPLYPGTSNLGRLRDFERVVYLNAEISNGAFNLGVTQQQLDCS